MAAIFIALFISPRTYKGYDERRIKQDVHALLERAPGFVCSVLLLTFSFSFCHYLYAFFFFFSFFLKKEEDYLYSSCAVIGDKIRHNYFKLMASFSPPRGTASLCLLLWTSLCSAILSTEHNFLSKVRTNRDSEFGAVM